MTRPIPPRPLLLCLSAALAACGDDVGGEATSISTGGVTLPATGAPETGEPPTTDDSGAPTSGGASDGATGTTAIGETPPAPTSVGETTAAADTTSSTTTAPDTGASSSSGGDESSSTGAPVDVCKASDDMDPMAPCSDVAPPNSFEPAVQWAWNGQDGDTQVLVTPVVANLTDDNGDGAIDLCDTPDIVVLAYPSNYYTGALYVLDGATGSVHYKVPDMAALTYPAVADIDADGVPEILTARSAGDSSQGYLMALEHDGAQKWITPTTYEVGSSAIAVADLDNDGDVEIVIHGVVFDHNGQFLWSAPAPSSDYVNTLADLDGDDDMEVILGPTAHHHDGSLYYSVNIQPGHPQVADLDADGLPEVLVASQSGLSLIQHDGALTYSNMGNTTFQPTAIHDMDGDTLPEIAAGSSSQYRVYENDLTVKWAVPIQDGSGYASSTAFDFLGDGTAEAMYADETTLFIFNGMGQPYLTAPRGSWTQWEMPIVVDVDNDGYVV